MSYTWNYEFLKLYLLSYCKDILSKMTPDANIPYNHVIQQSPHSPHILSGFDVTNLEIAVGQLKSDLSILQNAIDLLKGSDSRLESTVVKATDDITNVKLEVSNTFNNMKSDIVILQNDMKDLQEDLKDTKQCANKISDQVSSNDKNLTFIKKDVSDIKKSSLLNISSLSPQKIITWAGIIATAIVSITSGLMDPPQPSPDTELHESVQQIKEQLTTITNQLNTP